MQIVVSACDTTQDVRNEAMRHAVSVRKISRVNTDTPSDVPGCPRNHHSMTLKPEAYIAVSVTKQLFSLSISYIGRSGISKCRQRYGMKLQAKHCNIFSETNSNSDTVRNLPTCYPNHHSMAIFLSWKHNPTNQDPIFPNVPLPITVGAGRSISHHKIEEL